VTTESSHLQRASVGRTFIQNNPALATLAADLEWLPPLIDFGQKLFHLAKGEVETLAVNQPTIATNVEATMKKVPHPLWHDAPHQGHTCQWPGLR
jgi:hypothetical protein